MRAPRGYALPLTLALAGVLAGAFALYIARLEASSSVVQMAVRRQQVTYAADAALRVALTRAGNLLSAGMSPADVAANLAAATDIAPPGFAISPGGVTVEAVGTPTISTVPTGAFAGITTTVDLFRLTVEVHHVDPSGAVASLRGYVKRSALSPASFWIFVDDDATSYADEPISFTGRTYVNGDLCFGTTNTAIRGIFEQLTLTGEFLRSDSSECKDNRAKFKSVVGNHFIAKAPLGDANTVLFNTRATQSGNPLSTSKLSSTFLAATADFPKKDADPWKTAGGDDQYQPNSAAPLALNVTGTPIVQLGRDSTYQPESNIDRSRFLVDPMLKEEPESVRAQKFAFKSDIRILNGVWYLRNPAKPTVLGTPIWSDHPGSYKRNVERGDTMAENAADDDGALAEVGQEDLFPKTARPVGYSYYVTAPSNAATGAHELLEPNFGLQFDVNIRAAPVISYGSLRSVGNGETGDPYYELARPGHVGDSVTGQKILPADRRALLQATRTGFRDSWAEAGLFESDARRVLEQTSFSKTPGVLGNENEYVSLLPNMLPINFDVEAFGRALWLGSADDPNAAKNANELGGRLKARGSSSVFNGIVWVGSTWPGINNGYGATTADVTPTMAEFWPFQGRQADVNQPQVKNLGGPWTPAQLGPVIWLDAADASTLSTTSGKVTQWRDKSGNDRVFAQATVARQPTLTSAALNGKNVVTFSRAAGTALTSAFSLTVAEQDVYAVFKTTAAAGDLGGRVFSEGTSTDDSTFRPIEHTGSGRFGVTSFAAPYASQAMAQNDTAIWNSSALNASSTRVTVTTRENDANPLTGSNISGQMNKTFNKFAVGHGHNLSGTPSPAFDGYLAELIVLPKVASTDDRQRVVGYLANKWGLTGLLEAAHPYKAKAPAIPATLVLNDPFATSTKEPLFEAGTTTPVAAHTGVARPAPIARKGAAATTKSLYFQSALPFPLCTDGFGDGQDPAKRTYVPTGAASISDAIIDPTVPYRHTACDRYATTLTAAAGELNARPNAVRIHSAGKMYYPSLSSRHAAIAKYLARGLTIATNLPVYVQGDVNAYDPLSTITEVTSVAENSKPVAPAKLPELPAKPLVADGPTWIPFLVAGDTITQLSDSWEDAWSIWNHRAIGNAGLSDDDADIKETKPLTIETEVFDSGMIGKQMVITNSKDGNNMTVTITRAEPEDKSDPDEDWILYADGAEAADEESNVTLTFAGSAIGLPTKLRRGTGAAPSDTVSSSMTASDTFYWMQSISGWLGMPTPVECRKGHEKDREWRKSREWRKCKREYRKSRDREGFDSIAYIWRRLENWCRQERYERGSKAVVFASVFGLHADERYLYDLNDDGSSTASTCSKHVGGYDYMLDSPNNQAPGAPLFYTTSTSVGN